jgi:hypothetical protein
MSRLERGLRPDLTSVQLIAGVLTLKSIPSETRGESTPPDPAPTAVLGPTDGPRVRCDPAPRNTDVHEQIL